MSFLLKDTTHICYQVPFYFETGERNSLGLYGTLGNVSEMSSEKGIAFGGNYMKSYAFALKKEAIKYTEPEPWLGARIICEIVPTKI